MVEDREQGGARGESYRYCGRNGKTQSGDVRKKSCPAWMLQEGPFPEVLPKQKVARKKSTERFNLQSIATGMMPTGFHFGDVEWGWGDTVVKRSVALVIGYMQIHQCPSRSVWHPF